MPAPIRFDQLVVTLGREFRRRGMRGQVHALRTYFRRRRQRARFAALEGGVWDENTVVEWLAILRIPPFDHVYPVQSRQAPCPVCKARGLNPTAEFLAVFPGGCQKQCMECKFVWLVSDRSSERALGPGAVEDPMGGRRRK